MYKLPQISQNLADQRVQMIEYFDLQNVLKIDGQDSQNQRLICLKCPHQNKIPASFNISNLKKHLKSTKHFDATADPAERTHNHEDRRIRSKIRIKHQRSFKYSTNYQKNDSFFV